MIYRDYGLTGKKVSLLGFGGMRFAEIDDTEKCVNMMVKAAEGGVNYFDTAPGYFGTDSEAVFGKGFAELRRLKLPYYSATKTIKSTEALIRKEIDAQLKRMDIDSIDFYHIWCVLTLDDWASRKRDRILDTFRKLKNEGLIKHICVSSHLVHDQLNALLMEDVFEGVLFNYSAYNFKSREIALNAIRLKKLGAVVMNPLGGGIIPDHPELFGFIMRPGEKPVDAGLRFIWDHRDISSTIVGFRNEQDVADALSAMEGYKPRNENELAEIKNKAVGFLDGLCTGCSYCDNCPQSIPVPKYMDAFNRKLLRKKLDSDIIHRLKIFWSMTPNEAQLCTACGACEKLCTQHLPIVERLKYIAGL